MRSVLRITKAEFIKIFKNPSLYIMGILLSIVIAISLFGFNPSSALSYDINISGTTPQQIKTSFYSSVGSDSKNVYDQNFDITSDMLEFYTSLHLKQENLKVKRDEFYEKISQLDIQLAASASTQTIDSTYNEVKDSLLSLIEEYNTFYGLDTYSFFDEYINSKHFSSYYNVGSNDGLLNILHIRMSLSAQSFIDYYENNKDNITTKLNNIDGNIIKIILSEKVADINVIIDELNTKFLQLSPSGSVPIQVSLLVSQIQVGINNLNVYLTQLQNSQLHRIIYVNEKDFNNFQAYLTTSSDNITQLNQSTFPSPYTKLSSIVEEISKLNLLNETNTFSKQISIVMPTKKTIEYLNEYYSNIINTKRLDLEMQIADFPNEAQSQLQNDTQITELKNLLSSYKNLSENVLYYFSNSIVIDTTQEFSTKEIKGFSNLNDYNKYQINQELSKIEYLIKTNTYNYEYANVFSFNKNSANETTAFDFMFYALKISSVAIIVFAIIMASNIMAYEFDTGTIKLLAIRPFKRHKIVTGKLLAVLFFVFCFVMFSAIISFIGGIALYPLSTQPILATFNATTSFVISPAVLIFINIASILFETIFYTIVALALSTLFRSFAAAVSSSVIFLVTGLLFNSLLITQTWYTFIPFANTDFFKYLGGNIGASNSGTLNLLFTSNIASNATLLISVLSYGLFVGIVMSIAYIVFKRRDI